MNGWIELSAVALSVVTWAQPAPPQEALAACAGKTSGTACTVSTPDGDKAGTCHEGPHGEAVACMPKDGPGHHHGPPPPQALSACAQKTEGATCTFTIDSHTVDGTCETGPRGEVAACRPAHGRQAH